MHCSGREAEFPRREYPKTYACLFLSVPSVLICPCIAGTTHNTCKYYTIISHVVSLIVFLNTCTLTTCTYCHLEKKAKSTWKPAYDIETRLNGLLQNTIKQRPCKGVPEKCKVTGGSDTTKWQKIRSLSYERSWHSADVFDVADSKQGTNCCPFRLYLPEYFPTHT
jgi:hypothetical protein